MITLEKFKELALLNQLTKEQVADYAKEPHLAKLEKVFHELAEETQLLGWGWRGLEDWFTKIIREINSPELMLAYVKHYLNDDSTPCTIMLSDEDIRWLLHHESLDTCLKVLDAYLEKRKISHLNIQKDIYENEHFSFFEVLIDHQEIFESLQERLVKNCRFECVKDPQKLIMLRAYIAKYRLCEEAEVKFVRTKALAELVSDYAWRYGFCNRVQSGLLWTLLTGK